MKKLKLEISPDFTMDDIRKIRDYNYEMTKDMTFEERSAYYDERSISAMKWYRETLAQLDTQHCFAAEPEVPYGSDN